MYLSLHRPMDIFTVTPPPPSEKNFTPENPRGYQKTSRSSPPPPPQKAPSFTRKIPIHIRTPPRKYQKILTEYQNLLKKIKHLIRKIQNLTNNCSYVAEKKPSQKNTQKLAKCSLFLTKKSPYSFP